MTISNQRESNKKCWENVLRMKKIKITEEKVEAKKELSH